VADQVVGDLAEVLASEDGIGELLQGLAVDFLDRGDQLVELDGRCRHAVNPRLTPSLRQPQVDAPHNPGALLVAVRAASPRAV
jgi:hypothetical protein